MIRSVLVADDAPEFRELMRLIIEGWGVPVLEAADFNEAVSVARESRATIGLVLLDYFMPGDREARVRDLAGLLGNENVVLCTASGEARRRASELRLPRSLTKPVDLQSLESTVRDMQGAV